MGVSLGRRANVAQYAVAVALASLGPDARIGAAQETEETTAPRVDVIGTPENLPEISGTATVLGPQELETARVFTTTEALRKAPGVNVRDEEGFGLRPNIGIRGLNPSRSTKVLLLEDGIPLSYAPYGDNASYYHPPIDRFERIEVFKGSEQIRFGPQTAGGVINYITPVPTSEPGGKVGVTAGNRDYFNAHVQLGRGPVLLDYVRKQGDGSRDNTHSTINDLNLKSVMDLGGSQALTLRANVYTEDSDITYSGITQAELDNFGFEYNPFDNDTFEASRYGLSATHEVQFNPDVLLLTNVYGSYFSRDWWRQSSRTTDTQCGTAFRDARIAGQLVDPDTCNSTQGRLRNYTSYGIEPRLFVQHASFGLENHFEASVRAHYEVQERRQENGTSPTARSGTVTENNERRVDAYSAFAQNRFVMGRWTVTPGVRVEHIKYERTNNLTGASGDDTLTKWLPALGGTFNVSSATTLYAGVHRGFSPPRVEDLISNTGATSAEVPEDDAVEMEIGVRTVPRPGVSLQAAVFRNDFDQQVVVGSVAGGDLPLAVGETLYQGVELAGRLDFDALLGWSQSVYLRGAYQWLPTADIESPFEPVSPTATPFPNAEGNRVPYAPKHLLTVGLGYVHPRGFSGEIELVYTSEQYGDFANTEAGTADGLAGVLDDYTVVNIALNYAIPGSGWTTFFTVKNLFDEEYIADRTRGILPGTPRLYQAGVEYRF
jgi:Fe(3+) dicitrate transport protein